MYSSGRPELYKLLRAPTPQPRLNIGKVVDVRGRDFKGGHIPNATRNMRATTVVEKPKRLLEICEDAICSSRTERL